MSHRPLAEGADFKPQLQMLTKQKQNPSTDYKTLRRPFSSSAASDTHAQTKGRTLDL